jgi:hypothetical protein
LICKFFDIKNLRTLFANMLVFTRMFIGFREKQGEGGTPFATRCKTGICFFRQGLGEKYFAAADHEFAVLLHASMSAMLISFVILSMVGIVGILPCTEGVAIEPNRSAISKNIVTFCSGHLVEDSYTPEIILDSSAIHYGGQSIRQT